MTYVYFPLSCWTNTGCNIAGPPNEYKSSPRSNVDSHSSSPASQAPRSNPNQHSALPNKITMFAKLLALTTALAILAAATPAPAPAGSPSESCSTGSIQCCESVQTASSPAAASLLASIGVVVQDIATPIGITCSPISVVGVGGSDAW